MSDATMTTPGIAGWIEHSGPDAAAARAFYRDVIGWRIGDIPMQDGSGYSAIMVGDGPIGGFSPMPAEGGAWTIYVTVEDVDGCARKARAAGATILADPMDIPGVGRITVMKDPQGARIAAITYESMRK